MERIPTTEAVTTQAPEPITTTTQQQSTDDDEKKPGENGIWQDGVWVPYRQGENGDWTGPGNSWQWY